MAARFSSHSLPMGARWSGNRSWALAAPLGHLAIWVGCYAAAVVAMGGLLLHGIMPVWASLIAMSTAIGTYLIDRVRPLAGQVDPSDAVAHPQRARLLMSNPTGIRILAVVFLAAAMSLSLVFVPMASLVVAGAPIGVLLYGHRRRGMRLKDRLFIKNAIVALSMVAMLVLLVGPGDQPVLLMLAGLSILLHVFADAMLCDIDDVQADAQFGTRTIPNVLGIRVTWAIAMAMNLGSAALLLIAGAMELLPLHTAVILGLLPMMATMILYSWSPPRIKDLVDLKLPLAVALSWLLLLA